MPNPTGRCAARTVARLLATFLLCQVAACGAGGHRSSPSSPLPNSQPASPPAAPASPPETSFHCPPAPVVGAGHPSRPGTTAYIDTHVRPFDLQLSGAVAGSWRCAYVIRCGPIHQGWQLSAADQQLIGGRSVQLSVVAAASGGPGTFTAPDQLQGTLAFHAAPGTRPDSYRMTPGGRLTLGPDGQHGKLAAVFSEEEGGRVSVSGSFDCAGLAAEAAR